jgi:hypothetical protein
MGQFASITNLTMPEVVALVVQSVTDVPLALSDLNVIIQGLTPRSTKTPPPLYTDLALAVPAAITAATSDSTFIFDSLFPAITLPISSQDAGVVLAYNEKGNVQHLTTQLTVDLINWGIQLPANSITLLAADIKGQVDNSDLTPSTTYGQITIQSPTDEVLGWVSSFGVFRTGYNPDGSVSQAVIYSFCAATGVPEIVSI